MKEVSKKLNDFQLTYQFVACFNSMFLVRLNRSVFTRKRKLMNKTNGVVKFIQHFKGIQPIQIFSRNFLSH